MGDSMEMNLQKYLAFVKTVEYGSFTQAAEILSYSQSSISRMIADLENCANKIGREGVEANKNGDFNPPSGSFFYGMLKGDPDAGVNTVCNVASLVKSIDPCERIVKKRA